MTDATAPTPQRPLTRDERIAKRALIFKAEIQQARERAEMAGATMRCVVDVHTGCAYGTPGAIDCLCQCHDQYAPVGVS